MSLSISLSHSLSLSVCLVYLSIYAFVYLSVCLSISTYLPILFPNYLSMGTRWIARTWSSALRARRIYTAGSNI